MLTRANTGWGPRAHTAGPLHSRPAATRHRAGRVCASRHCEGARVGGGGQHGGSDICHPLRPPQPLPFCPHLAAPAPVGKPLLEAGLFLGRALSAAFTPLRRAAVSDILQNDKSLKLQFPREDLGFSYEQGAVCSSGTSTSGSSSDGGSSSGVGRGSGSRSSSRGGGGGGAAGGQLRGAHYEPSLVPGGRLPHCWLQVEGSGRQVCVCIRVCRQQAALCGVVRVCYVRLTATRALTAVLRSVAGFG